MRLESIAKVSYEFEELVGSQDFEGATNHLRGCVWSGSQIDGVLPGPSTNIDGMLSKESPDFRAVRYMIKDVKTDFEKELIAAA